MALRNKKIGRKGYIYTLDAAIGVVILAVGLMLVLGFYSSVPSKDNTQALSQDIVGVLAATPVSAVCTDINSTRDCTCSYSTLTKVCKSGQVTNANMSLLNLMGQLYYINEQAEAAGIVNDTIVKQGLIPSNYGFKMLLTDPSDPSTQVQLYPLVPK